MFECTLQYKFSIEKKIFFSFLKNFIRKEEFENGVLHRNDRVHMWRIVKERDYKKCEADLFIGNRCLCIIDGHKGIERIWNCRVAAKSDGPVDEPRKSSPV